jgi:hypothetical protein
MAEVGRDLPGFSAILFFGGKSQGVTNRLNALHDLGVNLI